MPPKRPASAMADEGATSKMAKKTKTATAGAATGALATVKSKQSTAEKANTGKKRATTSKAATTKKNATTATKKTAVPARKGAAPKKAAPAKAAPAKKAATKRKAEDEADVDKPAKKTKAAPKVKNEPKPKKEKPVKPAPPKVVINQAPSQPLSVYTFGEGSAGELGQGSKKKDMDIKRPRLLKNLADVAHISVGGMHVVALTVNNEILTWGVNDQGALGRDTKWSGGLRDMDGEESDSDEEPDEDKLNPLEANPKPVPAEAFPAGTKFVQVAASDSASFALTDDGLVYGWGTFRSNEGVLGFSQESLTEEEKVQKRPVLISSLKKITSITCGANHVLALDNKGKVYAWGSGQQMQLGRRINERHMAAGLKPSSVAIPRQKVKFISTGSYHSFAIDEKDQVWAWGLNSFGETGIPEGAGGDAAIIIQPTQVTSLAKQNVVQIDGGSHHSAGVTADGKILTWGRIDGGQLGIDEKMLDVDDEDVVRKDDLGRPRILLKPTQIPGDIKGTYVSCGPEHCLAITEQGRAYSWGFNSNYQLGQGHTDDVEQPELIDNTAVRDTKLVWAGAGGQFGVLAGRSVKVNGA